MMGGLPQPPSAYRQRIGLQSLKDTDDNVYIVNLKMKSQHMNLL